MRAKLGPDFFFVPADYLRYNASMKPGDADSGTAAAQGPRFATTCWSVVVAARDAEPDLAHQALATLCSAYWYPLYAYIRRQGHPAHAAEDLTQEFFARIVEKGFLAGVDRAKGKFRSFLVSACAHFLANQRDRERAWKRGGRCNVVSLDFTAAETRYAREPAHDLTPEKLFARRWGLTLLDQVLGALRQEYAAKNKANLFDRLRVCLLGDKKAVPYARLAPELGMSSGALRVAVHRLRQQFRELLREEIGRTVENPNEVEGEIRDLFVALGP